MGEKSKARWWKDNGLQVSNYKYTHLVDLQDTILIIKESSLELLQDLVSCKLIILTWKLSFNFCLYF